MMGVSECSPGPGTEEEKEEEIRHRARREWRKRQRLVMPREEVPELAAPPAAPDRTQEKPRKPTGVPGLRGQHWPHDPQRSQMQGMRTGHKLREGREYRSRPEIQEMDRRYRADPENRARQHRYQKEYNKERRNGPAGTPGPGGKNGDHIPKQPDELR